MSTVLDQRGLCSVAAKLISETFNVLSVTTWLIDEQGGRLLLGASTSQTTPTASDSDPDFAASRLVSDGLRERLDTFDLEKVEEDWAATLRRISSTQFRKGGNRICVPLLAGDRLLGVA